MSKDAKVVNGIIEPNGQDTPPDLIGRPGNNDLGLVRAGTAQGAYYFNSKIITIHANTADRTSLPLSNASIGSVSTRTASSLTRSGATATFLTGLTAVSLFAGQSVTVSGANQPEYNGTFTILTANTNAFTYTVGGTPASPATGTITAIPTGDASFPQWQFADNGLVSGATGFLVLRGNGGCLRVRSDWNLDFNDISTFTTITALVPGVVFLDGYFFVMDVTATIWNCDLNADPAGLITVWDATSFIRAAKESGAGVYLARSLNYIIALKEFSTESFYDAGNPAPGSPLSPVDNGFFPVGCASAGSVATVDGNLMWVSQTRQKGRSVHLMLGIQQQKISTPDIDRVLDADDLATVYSYGLKLGGHTLYVLTLVTSNITLVYDLTAQMWCQWSSLTVQSPASITSITLDGTNATVTFAAAHSLNDGDPLLIAGATPSGINGIKQVSYVSTTVVTFPTTLTGSVTGTLTGARYVESYFKYSHYVNAGGRNVLLHESDGHLYEILPSVHQDNGAPINVFSRTIRLDGGDLDWKRLSAMEVIGDTVSDFIMVRSSNDDGATHSTYRTVDMSLEKPVLRRMGAFRRRSIETRYVGNNYLRLSGFELELP